MDFFKLFFGYLGLFFGLLEISRFFYFFWDFLRGFKKKVFSQILRILLKVTEATTEHIYQALRFHGFCCSGSQLQNWALCKPNFEPNSINSQKK